MGLLGANCQTKRRRLSHYVNLFWAHYLMFFAKADSKNIRSIHLTLQTFMASSSLNINFQKSSLWFSPNYTPQNVIDEASFVLRIPHVPNPGSYLEFPLIFKGRKNDFNFIVDKVEGRISSWKSKYLSPMGKSILIKSVCFAVLAYYMQYLPFPKGICDRLDKIFRHFFWSSVFNEHKLHLLSWDKITRGPKDGGLGIFKTYERNLAFMSKLVWRIKTENQLTWVRICLSRIHLKSFPSSLIGMCLSRGYNIYSLGVNHIVHSGKKNSFLDWFLAPSWAH